MLTALLPRGSRLVLATCFLFLSFALTAQITGTVIDADTGDPLIGASILIKDTGTGTVTDLDGAFTISASPGDILVVSYTGFASQEKLVGNETTFEFLLSGGELLEEVVVTGYTAQSKRDITGAVTTVDSEELLEVPATTFAQQLQGRAAGVTVINDATPGGGATVRIRGYGTTGANNPLYVIDGVPTQDQGTLNQNDIESIQILKDASAASIYGSRAGNGVVIITTKKGKLGKPTLSYDAYYGIQNKANDVEALNAAELGEYLYLADFYAGKDPSHGQYRFTPDGMGGVQVGIPDYVFPSGHFIDTDGQVDESTYSLTPDNINAITRSADTDWWEEVTRDNAPITNHQISATGATEVARYAFSVNYFNQEAITDFVSYERMSLRANTQFTALNDRMRIGENFSVTFGNRKGGFGNDNEQNAVSGSYKHHPLLPIRDVAGNFAGSRGQNLGNNFNPYAILVRDQDDRSQNLRLLGNVYAELDLIPNLTFKTSLGIDMNTFRGRNIGRPQPEYVEGNFINSLNVSFNNRYDWTWYNTLSYNTDLGSAHKISGLVGTETIRGFGEFFNAGRQRFFNEDLDIISYLNLGDPTTAGNSGGPFRDLSLFSFFGQANYSFNDRYLLQVTARYDQSSRFLSATNAAVFPAFSIGWRISDEDFFSGARAIVNDLKIRYGWGQTGNQEIGDYNGYTAYLFDIFRAGYPIDGSTSLPTLGFGPAAFGNPLAQWEATTSNNIGFDAKLFDSRLSVELDLYNNVTSDLLLPVPTPYTAGDASNPNVNVGEVTNRGLDLGLNYSGGSGDFFYSIGGNFSIYRNEVTGLNDPDARLFGRADRLTSPATVTQVGAPLSSYYGLQVDGIFQSQAEADAHAPFGDTDYNAPGKFRFRDVAGDFDEAGNPIPDGIINDDDRTIIGNPHPDFTYGLNISVGYKAFELSIFGNGSQGNDVFNYIRYFADFNTFQGNRSTRALYDAWQPSNPLAPRSEWVAANPGATTPIMDADDQRSSQVTSYLIEDGSYFRLRNVQLTYTLPAAEVASKLGLSRAQVYLQAQNLVTITNYSGLNPEIQSGSSRTLGFDGGFMPVSRTITFGLNVSFQ